MATKAKEQEPKVLKAFLTRMNKTEKEVQKEQAADNLKELIWQCEAQINIVNSSKLPPLKLNVDKIKRAIIKSKEAVKTAEINLISSDFKTYIAGINRSNDEVSRLEGELASTEMDIKAYEDRVKKYETLLAKLKA